MTTIKIALKARFNDATNPEWCELDHAHGTHAVVRRGDKIDSIDYRQIVDELIYVDPYQEEIVSTRTGAQLICTRDG